MSRYIKLDDAEKAAGGASMFNGRVFVEVVLARLTDLPTIDIVRCGECKCCRDELIEEHMPLYIYCEKWNHETDFDGFCKYGERKDYE